MLNILFVLYHNFSSNSAVHVHHFANNLVELGCDCVVAVPDSLPTISCLGNHLYKITEFNEIKNLKKLFSNQQPPDIVHAWTPRIIVQRYCDELRKIYEFKLVVQLEDNEEHLIEKLLGRPFENILKEKNILIPDNFSHPIKYQEFLANSAGVTLIIDQLRKFVPNQVPTLTLWPGVDDKLFSPRKPDHVLAASLGIPVDTTVICYTGNVHLANAQEVRSIYLAVAMMNREGTPTILIRTGKDYFEFLGTDDRWARNHSIELGYVDRPKLPDILALADVLVQPGKADDFNNYRFPSKLPEFLAMGKPVILPKANIGNFIKHKKEALVLPVVDALNIVESVKSLSEDATLRNELSAGSVEFAKNNLNWRKNSELLGSFYQSIIS
jgi:glycosyltransferase involved in cell wall biosynthesis